MSHPQKHPGASKRLEALSDGIFAIAATLLVLEIHIPTLSDNSPAATMAALTELLPSLIAFVFSFLNILIFWVNHDTLGQVTNHFDSKLTYLNILFLLFISLVPFTTAFVSRNPYNVISVSVYGLVFLLTSVLACIMYYYIAFKTELMHPNVPLRVRKKIWKRVRMGPVLFASAIALGWLNVFIPIIIYILVPILFIIFPKIEFE